MKKRIALIVVIISLMAMCIGGTMAYFTADSTATNVITSGNIDIDLIEMEKTDEGLKPFKNKEGVMAGDQISKIVTVKNTGDNDAYVRVQVQKTITLAGNPDGSVDLSLISCDINTAYWTEKDGYYYYDVPLAAGEETAPLFTYVKFSNEMGNLYQGCKAQLDVNAQAVQVKNNGSTVFDAAGWPTE